MRRPPSRRVWIRHRPDEGERRKILGMAAGAAAGAAAVAGLATWYLARILVPREPVDRLREDAAERAEPRDAP